MDGLINIYKEKGFTSHDVVAKMRGILHTKKIGHTGTLDPDATGVLPVCVGKGTRACSLLEDHDKTYRAVLLLGRETDTQDVSGAVLAEKPVEVTEEEILSAAAHFQGKLLQIPPMYSALKVNGKKLYEYAREGKTIEREPRPIEVYELKVEAIDLPRVTITVHCSKGTYIRTICHDMGQVLGCGGCMESLVRTQAGFFRLEDAVTLAELEQLRDENRLDTCLVTLEQIFGNLPKVNTSPDADKLLHNGNRMKRRMFSSAVSGDRIRVYDSQGVFAGIYEYDLEKKDYRPLKMFL